jgi:glycosyltransferase involved in cell wall biosynthesis
VRISFLGNQGNWSFRQAGCLRAAGYDCTLFFFRDKNTRRGDPALMDPSLRESYPDWLVTVDNARDDAVYRRIERDFDIVIVSGNVALRHAFRLDPKRIAIAAHATGPNNVGSKETPDGSQMSKIETLRNADVILTAHPVTTRILHDLGLYDRVRFQLPLEDVIGVTESVDRSALDELSRHYGQYDRLLCWFSRNIMNPADPAYKAPEVFLRASAAYLKSHLDANIRIVFGNHGPDADEARALIASLGLESCTNIIDHQSFPRLLAYLSLPNAVVFDNLAQGTVSSGMFRDAMAMGAVLVRHISTEDIDLAYGPGCPVVDAYDEATATEAIGRLADLDASDFERLQQEARDWAIRHLHWESRVGSFVSLLRETIMRRRNLARGEALRSVELLPVDGR